MHSDRSPRAFSWCVSLLALIASAGCRYPATEVEVGLGTDIPVERRLDIAVHVSMDGRTDARTWSRGDLDGGISLPASFAVVPGANTSLDAPVEVRIEATVAASAPTASPVVIHRIARFRFRSHVTQRLPIFLSATCANLVDGCTTVGADACTLSARCEEQGLTCGDQGTCVDTAVEPVPAESSVSMTWLADAFVDHAPTPIDAPTPDVIDVMDAMDAIDAADAVDAPSPDANDASDANDAIDAIDAADGGTCTQSDDFTSATWPTFWTTYNGPPVVAQFDRTGGQLVITPPASTTATSYAGARTPYGDLRGVSSTVTLASTTTASSTSTDFGLNDATWMAYFSRTSQGLEMRVWDLAMHTTADIVRIADDRVAMRVLRLRNDGTPGVVIWETSPDGATWTVRRRVTTSMQLQNATVWIQAGSYGPVASPGTARFEQFVHEYACP